VSAFGEALKRLARRDHSEAELTRLLLARGHSPDAVREALQRLRERRALDDARFAAAYSRTRLAGRGLGPRRIRLELRRRGVGPEDLEQGLREALADHSESEGLDRVLRRLWQEGARLPPEKRLVRAWAALLRRGFAPALVRERLAVLLPRRRDMLDDLEHALAPAEDAGADEPGSHESAAEEDETS
jgi:regulatory protein